MAFLRESDPPPAVLAALSETHRFLAEAAQKDGLSATEALGAVLGLEGIRCGRVNPCDERKVLSRL